MGYVLTPMTLTFDLWPSKTIGFQTIARQSFLYNFTEIYWTVVELSSKNDEIGPKSAMFRPRWPWALTHDLQKQYSSKPLLEKASYIISLKYIERNLSYHPKTMKLCQNGLCFDPCDLDLWPTNSIIGNVQLFTIENNVLKYHEDAIKGTYLKRCERRADRWTDRRTNRQGHS